MLRRFSTFKKSKSDRDQEPKENGTVTTKQSKRQSKLLAVRKPSVEEDHSAKRTEVASVFEKHAQLLHASQRPLPNQNGDGTYQDHDSSSGLFQDVKSMGFKDVNTLKDLVKSKASGETVDDKTMLMERIIQVQCPALVSAIHCGYLILIRPSFLDL
jgi:linoleate 10R-lipoxygenase